MALKHLFFLSLLAGLLAASSPWISMSLRIDGDIVVIGNVLLFSAWLALQSRAVQKYDVRGLWLLASLPLFSLWPFLVYRTLSLCAHGHMNACP